MCLVHFIHHLEEPYRGRREFSPSVLFILDCSADTDQKLLWDMLPPCLFPTVGTIYWMRSGGLGPAVSGACYSFSQTLFLNLSRDLWIWHFSWALSQLRARNGHKTEKLDWSWWCQVGLGTLCISGGSMFAWILPPDKKHILTLELSIHPSYTSMASAFMLPSYTNSMATIFCSSPLTLLPHLLCCTLTKVTDKCLKYNQTCTSLSWKEISSHLQTHTCTNLLLTYKRPKPPLCAFWKYSSMVKDT